MEPAAQRPLRPYLDARSDQLPALMSAARKMYVLSKLPLRLNPYHAVVDANHVISAVRFKSKLQNPPRAHFEELIAAGVMVAYAPTSLLGTVPSKLARIAREDGLSLDRMLWHWGQIRSTIHFVVPNPVLDARWERLRERDAEDVPYCQLVEDLGADFLLTGDHDFGDAPVTVVKPQAARIALLALKLHVRARARELQSKGAGTCSAMLGIQAVWGLGKVVVRAPLWVHLGALAFAVVVLLNRDVRAEVGGAAKKVASGFCVMVRDLLSEGLVAEIEAGHNFDLALKHLPRRKPRPIQLVARRMVLEDEGWTVSELEAQLRTAGHVTEPEGRARWLLRTELAASPLFEQGSDRRWRLRSGSIS